AGGWPDQEGNRGGRDETVAGPPEPHVHAAGPAGVICVGDSTVATTLGSPCGVDTGMLLPWTLVGGCPVRTPITAAAAAFRARMISAVKNAPTPVGSTCFA